MGILDRIKQGAAKRKADKAKKNAKWVNPAQPATTPAVKRNGSGPDKSGNDKYKPTTVSKPTSTKPTTKKKPLSLYQKDLLAKKNKTGKYAVKKPGTDYSKKTDNSYSGVTNDDKKGQADIAANNKRVTTNRKNKAAVKSGEKYTFIDSNGKKQTVTKGAKKPS